jgi:hypothetical protein
MMGFWHRRLISCWYDYCFKSAAISANWAKAAGGLRRFLGNHVGLGEIGAVFERFVLEPEDVEVEFVALESALRR